MKNIFKIIKISKPLHKLFLVLAVLILTNAFLALLTPIFSKFIVDEIIAKIQSGEGDLDRVVVLIAASFGINVLSTILGSVSERLGDHTAGRLRKFLMEKFYMKIFTLPQSYFDSEISGRIIHQLNRGIDSIQGFANTSTNFFLPSFLQTIFTIIVLLYYNVYAAFFVFILFPIYGYFTYLSTKKWGMYEVQKNKFEDTIRGRISEVIPNIKLVKSFNNEPTEYELISENLSESNKIYAKQSRYFHIFDFLRNMSLNIIVLIVTSLVFYNAFHGRMSVGEMVLIIQLVAQAQRPLFALSFILGRIQQAESGSKEYFEILHLPSNEKFGKKPAYKSFARPEIKFEDVSFQYESSQNVLKDVIFDAKAGEKVALVGPSGAGKTTIINLILKFYNPTDGEIFINKEAYSGLEAADIRSNITLVFQDNELFSSTIRENVAYASKATDAQVIKALKAANAYDFVKKLPEGINAQIGERGVKLSGGQKQRIQIARAILKDAPILILDEATSSLDSKSEMLVQDALENLMKDKLVIIVAHRFSTIQNVDKIIVLDKGKVVDVDAPKELAKRPGIYSDLLKYQIEGNKKLLANYELY